MTLAELRGTKRRKVGKADAGVAVQESSAGEVAHVAAPGERAHPGPAEYIRIGVALGIVTAIEVGVYYLDVGTSFLVTTLLILSGLKFSLVALWFMHLKFDSRLFSWLFVGGLALAMAIFMVVLASLEAGLV